MEKNNKVLISLGIGLAVGTVLGILFAPNKGEDTRKKIKDTGTKLSDDLTKSVTKIKESVQGFRNNVKEKVDGVTGSVNDYI
ncbi:MAG: YtxH domain-containing protein [Sphingobacteriales bacterium]|nr:YtxH domain-containing protein [Sphingobacteriales bacterium]